jgi:hypothetical protein
VKTGGEYIWQFLALVPGAQVVSRILEYLGMTNRYDYFLMLCWYCYCDDDNFVMRNIVCIDDWVRKARLSST